MKTQFHHTVLTDSLERELLQAELAQQMNFPLEGVFSAAARRLGQLAAKVAGAFRFHGHAGAKTA